MNIDFWSALSGFIGTVMLFFFGLPPRLNPEGHINLILEQSNNEEKEKYKMYDKLSYFALGLIASSFLLQIIKILFNVK
ncbi:hypothetical protein COS50_03905 [Candidatus Roizmanbacteria bacterium CG03_land_8_20_14_0_80_35_26]|uniref:DUF4149 domain-containing protein n=2 Tax=Candidatus Roizmaniibacteriota TaxID=1752723 RepID=A0A2M7BVX2_9BACT|nr:MAG: hypothetical protein COS50_03905 [Candidatus Roizmanbacteria bacterium CG03_land_8_20_14_0_80_35_26]PJC32200.1 MAG: hypothetical protein CO049_03465 [Candidatus Roizmanbacteria bacterium CG_4_9_14_0_2_um_filter_36_12]